MNLWHDVSTGDNTPDEVNIVVEINKGSKNKYEIDKTTGLIALDRVMHTSQDYPFDYGFVPRSYWHDKDPLDVVVLTTHPLMPGILATVRPVAIMNMLDNNQGDDKLICVPVDDPRFEHVHDLKDIHKHTLKEIEHFFSTYKKIQNKPVEVTGFKGVIEAKTALNEALALYKKEFPKA
ncbi:MAG: inorganic diphosphatase [Patescibacteria group bacterium]